MDQLKINQTTIIGDDKNIEILYKSDREKAVKRFQKETIYGRDGYYASVDGAYEGYEGTIDIITKTQQGEETLSKVFDSHIGEFTVSLNDHSRHEIGRIKRHTTDLINTHHILHRYEIDYQPFLYTDYNIVKRPSANINNPGIVKALPLIKLVGGGEVQMTIGSETFAINAQGGIVIDSEQFKIVDLSGEYSQRVFIRVKDFPTIQPGISNISVLGANDWEIKVRWRYL